MSVVFLSGVGRSGTTWLSNIINHDRRYRYIFEPFHKFHGVFETYSRLRYINEYDKSSEYIDPMRSLFNDDFNNDWSDMYEKDITKSDRLIKGIRSNLMLRWVWRQFPDNKYILLLRHPCAVALSRVKMGWNPPNLIDLMLSQKRLVGTYLYLFRKTIEKITQKGDPFMQHVLLWCIANYVPLRQFFSNDPNIFITTYEKLLFVPKIELTRLFNYLGQEGELPDTVFERFDARSQQSRMDSAQGTDRLKAWTREVSRNQLKATMDLLREFGLTDIYFLKDILSRHPATILETV